MFLVKCSCKCFFTIKPESLTKDPIHCPNCKKAIELIDVSNPLETIPIMQQSGISVSVVPDNAKVTVTYDV